MKQIKMRYASPIVEFNPAAPVDILLGSDTTADVGFLLGSEGYEVAYMNSREQEIYLNENHY
ncbi:MAG: hypothetical protein ACI4RV_08065 [Eubacteriales bacterium]